MHPSIAAEIARQVAAERRAAAESARIAARPAARLGLPGRALRGGRGLLRPPPS